VKAANQPSVPQNRKQKTEVAAAHWSSVNGATFNSVYTHPSPIGAHTHPI